MTINTEEESPSQPHSDLALPASLASAKELTPSHLPRDRAAPRNLALLYTAIVAVPFGVGLQNCVWTVCAAVLGLELLRLPRGERLERIERLYKNAGRGFAFAAALIVWLVVASLVNPAQRVSVWAAAPFGYLAWLLLPALFVLHFQSLRSTEWQRLGRLLAYVTFGWGLVSLSQYLFGWRLVGFSIHPDLARPRGFYSHPLSLAYAALLVWPLAVVWLTRNWRSTSAWLLLVGGGLLVILSQSRTVQVVALVVLVLTLLRHLRGRWLTLAISGLLTGLILLKAAGFTEKYEATFSKAGEDRLSTYPDDRLAFWHAHWLMFEERPLLGHGFALNTAYRQPYYQKLGLADFKKQYEAHNIYLQILAEGGVVGLGLFLAWITCLLHYSRRLLPSSLPRLTGQATVLAFFTACFTQNAFHDASVRSGILVLWSALLLVACESRSAGPG